MSRNQGAMHMFLAHPSSLPSRCAGWNGRIASSSALPLLSTDLTTKRLLCAVQNITQACERVCERLPQWRSYPVALPVWSFQGTCRGTSVGHQGDTSVSRVTTMFELNGFDINQLGASYNNWLKTQPPAVEVILTGLASSVQGAAIGYLLGSLSPPPDPSAAANPAISAQLKALQAGGPFAQARNLGVLTGVNAALSLAIKKARNGKEDVYGSMAASFGSGVAYSLVSGSPNPLQSAVTTGMAFALFNGLFYQISNMFKPDHPDTEYDRGKYMLTTLGLQKYHENLKKALLTDQTIMLWNESALTEARIPPGPRLLILHHLDTYRSPASVLKPALPLPPLPPPTVAAAQAAASGRTP